MAHGAERCNSAREGVFDHVDPPLAIDQRKIDANIGQKPLGFARQKFVDGREDPTDLRPRQMRGRKVMGPALLDFDKDDNIAIPSDQIDLSSGAAPVPGADRDAAAFIVARDRTFGSMTRMMVPPTACRPAALNGRRDEIEWHQPCPWLRSSAIW